MLTWKETLYQSLSNGKLKMLPGTAIEGLELPLPGQDDCKVFFYPLMVNLSNHRWLVWASFDKLRMSRNR